MVTSNISTHPQRHPLVEGFRVQARVVKALLLRELHIRYGRENIGYLWLIGEPMMLATVIGLIHSGHRTEFGTDIRPLPLAVLGYTIFIMFRGIVNRAEGALEGASSLLYHKMVTTFDIMLARALMEWAGTLATLMIMMTGLVLIGQAEPPARPLYLIAAVVCMFWNSFAQSMIVAAASHDNRTVGRLVHTYSYFNIPLSCAFFQVEWIPHPYREYIQWLPLPNIFEMARYGQFRSAKAEYFDSAYLVGWNLALTWIGLIMLNKLRERMHVQ